MKKKVLSALILILVGLLSFSYLSLPAQAEETSCFDYYKFQSVEVSVGKNKEEYKPGELVVFTGELVNENDYPVVDGNVFVKVGKKNPNYLMEGHFIVDEYVAQENVVLAAKERKDVMFVWPIPNGISAGDYRADFFFSAGKKFNLGGLPFTNEVVIGSSEFKIDSDNQGEISFDKSATEVNGQKYKHIGNLPVIDPGQEVKVNQPIKNSHTSEKKVQIKYDLYFWDSLNEKDKISTREEEITIPANGTANLSYLIDRMADSVYYLKITASLPDQKSIVNIRLSSEQSHPRLNYPAISNFPLVKGDSADLFSCFHNTSGLSIPGKVTVSLFDKQNKPVAILDHKGEISGKMLGAKQNFQAGSDYPWLKLTASIKDENGKIVDQYETVYDCQKIQSDKCRQLLASLEQKTIDWIE